MMRYRLGTKTGLMTSVSRCVPKSADQAQSVPSDNTCGLALTAQELAVYLAKGFRLLVMNGMPTGEHG